MAGKGGGAWKVAYADFVTAMMAFFMVMWIVAQSKPVKQAVAQYFKDPFHVATSSESSKDPAAPAQLPALPGEKPGGSPRPGLGPGGARSPSTDRTKLGPARGEGNNPSVYVLHDGARSNQGAVIPFDEGSAELNAQALERLNQVAPALRGKRHKIEIRGHASRRPLPRGSPFKDLWQLAYARCLATMKFLEQHGIDSERMRLSQAGPFEPFTIRADAEAQAQNSRVELYLLNETVEELVGTREERAQRVKTPFEKRSTSSDRVPADRSKP